MTTNSKNKKRTPRFIRNCLSGLAALVVGLSGCKGNFNSDSPVVQNNPPIIQANKQEPRSSIKLTYSPRVVDGAADSDWNGGSIKDSGTIMDLHRFLGYNNMTSYNFEFAHDITPKDRITFNYDYSEAQSNNWGIRGEVFFDHIQIPANTKVSSNLLMQRLSAQYDRLLLDKSGFKVRAGAGMEHLHLRFQLKDLETPQSDVEDVNDAWNPYLTLGVSKELGSKATASLDISKSLPVAINDITQDGLKINAGVEYQLNPTVSFLLGYSWDNKKIEDKNEDSPGINCYEVNSDGVNLGVRVKF